MSTKRPTRPFMAALRRDVGVAIPSDLVVTNIAALAPSAAPAIPRNSRANGRRPSSRGGV